MATGISGLDFRKGLANMSKTISVPEFKMNGEVSSGRRVVSKFTML
jgi:hypothetical protein